MRGHSWIVIVALVIGACSDDTIELAPAEFGELCGEVGPVQILALDPSRPLDIVRDRGIFGDRRVLQVGYLDVENATPPSLATDTSELWSVGPCGEDPLKLVETQGLGNVVTDLDVWPDTLLSCDKDTGQVFIIDPTGIRSPNVVFQTHECFMRWTDDGLLTILPQDEESGTLVLQPWPDDPWTMTSGPIVVLDSVSGALGVTEDDYFGITNNNELVAISRVDGEATTVATDVLDFATDSTGRYVVWQGVYVTNDESDWPEGPIYFTDRQTGEETSLLIAGSLSYTSSPFVLESLDILSLGSSFATSEYYYRIPTLEVLDMPTGMTILQAIDETRVLLSDRFYRGPYSLLDTATVELTELYDGHGNARLTEDELFVLDGVECCTDENTYRRAGRLVHVPFDGAVEVVARRATMAYQFTTDNRVLTTVDIESNTNLVGSLIVVDPDTLDEHLIADHVLSTTPSAHTEIDGDPIVVYTIIDPERQGVWMARLAD